MSSSSLLGWQLGHWNSSPFFPEFFKTANMTGKFKLEVLAVWDESWGAPDGILHWQKTLTEDTWLPDIHWGDLVGCTLHPSKQFPLTFPNSVCVADLP